MLAQMWEVSEGTVQEIQFKNLLPKTVSVVMASFRRNMGFRLNLTFDDLCWHQYWPKRKFNEILLLCFQKSLRTHFFRFSLRRLVPSYRGSCLTLPPPIRWRKIQRPIRAWVNLFWQHVTLILRDLGSYFDPDIAGSNHKYFDASRREKHDSIRMHKFHVVGFLAEN